MDKRRAFTECFHLETLLGGDVAQSLTQRIVIIDDEHARGIAGFRGCGLGQISLPRYT